VRLAVLAFLASLVTLLLRALLRDLPLLLLLVSPLLPLLVFLLRPSKVVPAAGIGALALPPAHSTRVARFRLMNTRLVRELLLCRVGIFPSPKLVYPLMPPVVLVVVVSAAFLTPLPPTDTLALPPMQLLLQCLTRFSCRPFVNGIWSVRRKKTFRRAPCCRALEEVLFVLFFGAFGAWSITRFPLPRICFYPLCDLVIPLWLGDDEALAGVGAEK